MKEEEENLGRKTEEREKETASVVLPARRQHCAHTARHPLPIPTFLLYGSGGARCNPRATLRSPPPRRDGGYARARAPLRLGVCERARTCLSGTRAKNAKFVARGGASYGPPAAENVRPRPR